MRASGLEPIHARLDRLERFSHGARATYIGNNRVLVKVVVADNVIAYFVEADDLLISPWFIVNGAYETHPTNYFLRTLRPDSHCLDIGSNFGYFACLMARFCPAGRVIAIEPDRHVFELVRDNLAINGFTDHAQAIHAAACDHDQGLTLHRRVKRSGNTSLISVGTDFTDHMGEPAAEQFDVASVRVDGLLPRLDGRVDVMKIDVEGAEPLVFRGAAETIARNPQVRIVMEWSPGQIQGAGFDVAAFVREIAAHGLQFHAMDRKRIWPVSADELLAMPYQAGIVLAR